MNRLRFLPTAALAALVLFATTTAQAQDAAWQRVPLDAGASAEFPGTPTPKQMSGNAGLLLTAAGPTIYVALVAPAALPADAPDSVRTAFYQARLAEANLGANLLSQRPVEVAGTMGLEYVYKVPADTGGAINHDRVVVLGDKLYALSFGSRTPDEATTVTNRERFLSSLRAGAVSADEAKAAATAAANAPAPAEATAEKRSLFSPATILAGLLGGLGALWLIRRRAAQANKPNA